MLGFYQRLEVLENFGSYAKVAFEYVVWLEWYSRTVTETREPAASSFWMLTGNGGQVLFRS